MKRFIFFGEDVVPLRRHIDTVYKFLERDAQQKIRIAELEKKYNEVYVDNKRLTSGFSESTARNVELLNENGNLRTQIDNLEYRLSKFSRTRGKNGKFTKNG